MSIARDSQAMIRMVTARSNYYDQASVWVLTSCTLLDRSLSYLIIWISWANSLITMQTRQAWGILNLRWAIHTYLDIVQWRTQAWDLIRMLDAVTIFLCFQTSEWRVGPMTKTYLTLIALCYQMGKRGSYKAFRRIADVRCVRFASYRKL